MLKSHHRVFQSIQIARDTLVAGAAFLVAFWFRYHSGFIALPLLPNVEESILTGLYILSAWPIFGWFSGLYISHRTRSWAAETLDVVKVSALTLLALVSITYFTRDERYSRSMLVLWFGLNVVLVCATRLVFRQIMQSLRSQGYNQRRVLIIGTGELARTVVHLIRDNPGTGLHAEGVLALNNKAELVGSHVAEAPVLGLVKDLPRILGESAHKEGTVDQVIIALPVHELRFLESIMQLLSQETVDVRLIPDVHQFITLCGSVEEFRGLPIINLQATPLAGWSRFSKRAFDLVMGGLGLVMLSPILLCIGLIIRLGSPGPIFFRQVRVGLDGQTFPMYKFRTMTTDSEKDGPRMTDSRDNRCTPIGRWLRRLSIDELPQLWNVCRGDMSLVGPRPEQPAFIEVFKKEIPRYALRHKIKAGMTGWAQVNGMRGNTSIKKRIEMDLYYIENWSFSLDLKIILRTVFGGFLSPNAY